MRDSPRNEANSCLFNNLTFLLGVRNVAGKAEIHTRPLSTGDMSMKDATSETTEVDYGDIYTLEGPMISELISFTKKTKRRLQMPFINPYLTFQDTCEEAFEHYRSVFGGEFAMKMRMTDIDMGVPVPAGAENLIMHVALPIGGQMLMGSDAPEGFGPPIQQGNNYSAAVGVESREEADRIYNGLAGGGGETSMPMGDAPWGDYFGMLTDRFGINWMVSFDPKGKTHSE